MDALSITKAITKVVLVILMLAVFSFSVFLAPEINGSVVSMALIKSSLTGAFGWIFFLILSDAVVKSIAASALDARAERKDGGMLYHFLKPDVNEILEEENSLTQKTETGGVQ